MELPPELVERIRSLPDKAGIYVFRGRDSGVLYVGKAKSLRKRAASYLSGVREPRLQAMLREATDLEFVLTGSESEALLLENEWIKARHPRYNILLRDDKTYPYLRLSRDPFPALSFTRRIRKDGAEYFGPYLPAGLARKAIKRVQRLFQIRVCDLEIDGSLPRPCLYHDLRRCLGPCVEGLTTPEAYGGAVEQARLFLAGRNREVIGGLRRAMREASAALEFERAAALRDAIAEIEAIGKGRTLASLGGEDVDIYGVHAAGNGAAATILVMRGGRVLDRREIFWEGRDAVEPDRFLSEVLPQVYATASFIPKEIHLPCPVEGAEALSGWLSSRKGSRVYLRTPARGPKAKRVELAMRNAEQAFRRRFRVRGSHAGAQALARHLGLSEAPRRIEAFDISTLQGTETVAAMVVWEEGRLRRGEYRSFNIRNLQGQDDFAALREAVERRYRRRLEEVGWMPDLVLVDGGRGQLNAVLGALTSLGVEETPVAALAKRQEELYLPGHPAPLRLPRRDPALQLLQSMRDEVHRFALARHRRRRVRRALDSRLDGLEGVGPKRRRVLLRRFGSFEGVRHAAREDLQAALGPRVGSRLYDSLRRQERYDP